MLINRHLFVGGSLKMIIALIFLCFNHPLFASELKTLRIGYQPYGTLILVKGRGQLETKLFKLGIAIEWVEFKTGIAMLGEFGKEHLDFLVVGEVPPVFMQSAHIPFVYVGHEPPSPRSEAIVVPKNSTITTIADLKGKKIAFVEGTISCFSKYSKKRD